MKVNYNFTFNKDKGHKVIKNDDKSFDFSNLFNNKVSSHEKQDVVKKDVVKDKKENLSKKDSNIKESKLINQNDKKIADKKEIDDVKEDIKKDVIKNKINDILVDLLALIPIDYFQDQEVIDVKELLCDNFADIEIDEDFIKKVNLLIENLSNEKNEKIPVKDFKSKLENMFQELKANVEEVKTIDNNEVKSLNLDEFMSKTKLKVNNDSKDNNQNSNFQHKDLKSEETMDFNFNNEKFNIDENFKTELKVNNLKQNIDVKSIYNQIKSAIKLQDIGKHSEIVIKLKPAELGKVELKLEIHKDSVVANINVENSKVKQVLESNLDDLKNSLKDKGFSDMSFDVNVNQDNKDDKKYEEFIRINYKNKREYDEIEKDYKETKKIIGNNKYVLTIPESNFEHLA